MVFVAVDEDKPVVVQICSQILLCASNRNLGKTLHVTIYLYDHDDCPDGPKCPYHLYECPDGPYCDKPYEGGGGDNIYDEDYGVDEDVYLEPCNQVTGDEDLSLTTVKWYFHLETNTDDPSNVAESVCGVMGNKVIGAFEDHCELGRSERQRRLNESRRRLEIKGYSQQVTCTHYEDCMPTDSSSKSCGVYEATVVVAFDGEGDDLTSAGEVSSTVTGAAEDSFVGDDIKNTVNEQLDDTGEAATVVGYGNPNSNEEASAGLSGEIYTDESGGLTKAGKAAIAAMSALIVLLLLLCFICWRRHRNGASDSKSVGSGNTELSPSRRFGAGGGSRGGSRSSASLTDDDMTYMTSDMNNLGMHHSKLDVHKCSSASCDQCNPIIRQEMPGVYFVGSRGGAPLSDIVEEEYKSSSEYRSASETEEDIGDNAIPPPPSHPPPTDGDEKEKKSFFSRFRRSKAEEPKDEGPIVQPQGGEGDIEIEI